MSDFTVTKSLTKKQLADLLCSGMEGGIGYWAQIVEYKKPRKVWQWFE